MQFAIIVRRNLEAECERHIMGFLGPWQSMTRVELESQRKIERQNEDRIPISTIAKCIHRFVLSKDSTLTQHI